MLGTHVKQQGSLVAPDRLRFDFSHFEPVTADQIRAIEDLVNREVLDNDPVRHFETTMDEARDLGAIAFFGDKYGEIVRVLEAGRHSIELCGGTHVPPAGDIGPMKIVSEGSIGSNLRRIEAVTGIGPIDRLREEEDLLARAADALGTTGETAEGIEKRQRAEGGPGRDQGAAAQAAGNGAAELAAGAVDGVVVARVDGTTATRCASWPWRCASSPASGPWSSEASPRAAAWPWWRPPRRTADSTPRSSSPTRPAPWVAAGRQGRRAGRGRRPQPEALDEALDQARAAAVPA